MTFLTLPVILATVVMLQSVDAACVEDNCYGAVYWNPAGPEECSSHFITTVIPPASTTTLTITSAVPDATTITGPFVGASTVTPEDSIPTYIVRACYGDVAYRFESACSCIAAGPTSTTAAVPVVTDTVIVPFNGITPAPLPTTLPPVPLPVPTGGEPACVPIGLKPVIVTVQVDEVFAMTLTVSGPTLCIGETAPPASLPSVCNCTSALPSAPFSSFTGFANRTSTDSFSTVLRTSSFTGFFNRSTVATSDEPTSTPAPTSLETSETLAEPSTSASVEPSSTQPSQINPGTTSSAPSGPTSFVPVGRQVILQIISGTYDGQYIETDEPDETIVTNLRSHVTPDRAYAATWTLDATTQILFQEINGQWWGAYFNMGRTLWSSILLLPADTIVSWLVAPAALKTPLKCVIDFTASNVITCGQQQWTRLLQSDKCGWAISTPFNPGYAASCPDSEELFLQAIVDDIDEGISK